MVWRGHRVYDNTHKGYYIGIYADFLIGGDLKKEWYIFVPIFVKVITGTLRAYTNKHIEILYMTYILRLFCTHLCNLKKSDFSFQGFTTPS